MVGAAASPSWILPQVPSSRRAEVCKGPDAPTPQDGPGTILHLELVEGPLAGTSLTANRAERYQVGRTRSSKSFQIKDSAISEKHAEIVWRTGQWLLRDLGSSNGTQLNGEPLEEGGEVAVSRSKREVACSGRGLKCSLPHAGAVLSHRVPLLRR